MVWSVLSSRIHSWDVTQWSALLEEKTTKRKRGLISRNYRLYYYCKLCRQRTDNESKWTCSTWTRNEKISRKFLSSNLTCRSNEGSKNKMKTCCRKLTSDAQAEVFWSSGKSLRSSSTQSPVERDKSVNWTTKDFPSFYKPRQTNTTSDPITSTENKQSKMYKPGSRVPCKRSCTKHEYDKSHRYF